MPLRQDIAMLEPATAMLGLVLLRHLVAGKNTEKTISLNLFLKWYSDIVNGFEWSTDEIINSTENKNYL